MSIKHDPKNMKIVSEWFGSINANQGIGEDLFLLISQLTPMLNVDIIVRNNANEILLTWRNDNYYGPGWHIPGGIVRHKEKLLDRVKKVAKKELLLDLKTINGPLGHHEMFNSTRNIRGHFISFVFESKVDQDPDISFKSGESPRQGEWKWFKSCPKDFIKNQKALRVYF